MIRKGRNGSNQENVDAKPPSPAIKANMGVMQHNEAANAPSKLTLIKLFSFLDNNKASLSFNFRQTCF